MFPYFDYVTQGILPCVLSSAARHHSPGTPGQSTLGFHGAAGGVVHGSAIAGTVFHGTAVFGCTVHAAGGIVGTAVCSGNGRAFCA